jgi:hypothetical protein
MPKTSKSSHSKPKASKKNKNQPPEEISSKARSITEAVLPQEWLPDLNVLRRVIKRTREINDPRMDLFSQKSAPQKKQFKIATISTSLVLKQLGPMEERDYKIWLVDTKYRKQLREEFLKYLTKAAEAGAKLICFNELAYPTPLDKGDTVFMNQIKKLVAKHNLTLVAGSYHDAAKFYNLSPVVAPKDGVPHAIAHAKMTSAVRAFELIRIPPNRHLRYYQTQHGLFAVLICIDVYDPSLIFRLMMKNHLYSGEEKIDFVFVPSFTSNDAQKLAEACKDLSYATATLVVYVNCSEDMPRHVIYLAGEEVKNNSEVVKCKVTGSRNLQILTIAYDEYQRMRSKVSDAYSPVFDYQIGIKDGIRIDVKL